MIDDVDQKVSETLGVWTEHAIQARHEESRRSSRAASPELSRSPSPSPSSNAEIPQTEPQPKPHPKPQSKPSESANNVPVDVKRAHRPHGFRPPPTPGLPHVAFAVPSETMASGAAVPKTSFRVADANASLPIAITVIPDGQISRLAAGIPVIVVHGRRFTAQTVPS